MSVTSIRIGKSKDVVHAKHGYRQNDVQCAYCGEPCYVKMICGGITCLKAGHVHKNPICRAMHDNKKIIDPHALDIDVVRKNTEANINPSSGGKGGTGGTRGAPEKNDEQDEVVFVPSSAHSLVNCGLYKFENVVTESYPDMCSWLVNQENAHRLNRHYDSLGFRYFVAEPYDFYSKEMIIQFRMPIKATGSQLMINVKFDDYELFIKVRKKLFYAKDKKSNRHNIPKYQYVLIYGRDWLYTGVRGFGCADQCKLYLRNCSYCRISWQTCDGLIYTTGAKERFVTRIPEYRLTQDEGIELVNNRTMRR